MSYPIIFDGHNDLLSRLARKDCRLIDVKSGYSGGHIDLPRAKAGGFGGGFFAIYIENDDADFDRLLESMAHPPYHVPLPAPIAQVDALPRTLHQAALLQRLEHIGVVRICTDTEILEETLNDHERLAAILHLEGAEAIDENFNTLEVLYAAGLRSIGPVWSRNNQFGEGVPFAFPSGADIGKGLSGLGIALVKACNQLGILIDVSHLNARGFWDVVEHSHTPIVATHSNAYALSNHSRNLSDDQLSAIAESDGLVGVNFAAMTLREDGTSTPKTYWDDILRQFDYLLGKLGENRIALGSDFDGATIPSVIGDCAGLPGLMQQLIVHGYNQELLEKFAHQNWLRVLAKTWRV